MLTIGIDLGGSSIKAAALSNGAVVASVQSAEYARPDGVTLRDALAGVASALAESFSAHGLVAVDAVGLCVPGVVDAASGRVVSTVNLPGLVGVDVVSLVRSGFRVVEGDASLPVLLSTDAAATAVDLASERGSDSEPIADRLAAICLGTGVGLGVVDGGVLVRVDGASAGHLGQVDVGVRLDDGTIPVGPDGGRGSLEAYCGAAALRERFGGDLASSIAGMGAEDPCLCALARAIRIVHAIYRPRVVVLAGGIGMALRPCVPVLETMVADQLTAVADPAWRLVAADRIDHAARGGARLAAAGLAAGSSML